MKEDIILAGVGGQGILSIAAVIGSAALEIGMYMKQSEVHGMSQRGGDVMSNLRIADHEIFSDLIPCGKADLIISVEPMEALRHLPMLSHDGWLITNSTPFKNTLDYPDVDKIMATLEKIPNHIVIDADKIAKDLGSTMSANMVILGAACPFLDNVCLDIENGIRNIFGRKGEKVIKSNMDALKAGREYTTALLKKQTIKI
ncbi:MAG: indolepyruvate oxidoreductase subunit beta [Bacteroidia bacterium]|nr:indolepyruvate oxidoreductase subunit beta [Bacteroidia bacterium]